MKLLILITCFGEYDGILDKNYGNYWNSKYLVYSESMWFGVCTFSMFLWVKNDRVKRDSPQISRNELVQ